MMVLMAVISYRTIGRYLSWVSPTETIPQPGVMAATTEEEKIHCGTYLNSAGYFVNFRTLKYFSISDFFFKGSKGPLLEMYWRGSVNPIL